MSLPSRYDGRPILLIVENYALAVLGELSKEQSAAMRSTGQRVWAGGEDWMATVRARLDWEASIDDTIRENWAGYQDAARKQRVSGSAAEFVRIFADAIEKDASQSD